MIEKLREQLKENLDLTNVNDKEVLEIADAEIKKYS